MLRLDLAPRIEVVLRQVFVDVDRPLGTWQAFAREDVLDFECRKFLVPLREAGRTVGLHLLGLVLEDGHV